MSNYEFQYARVRIRRDLYEKLKSRCEESIVDCVNKLLEKTLIGADVQPTSAPMPHALQLPVDCKAVRIGNTNLYRVDCGGRLAVIPSFAMRDFMEKLGVSVEFEGGMPEELSRSAPKRVVAVEEEEESEEEEEE